MNTPNNLYHYLESGLDNIYLLNGFKYIDSPHGKQITIKDIDGLHKAIGSTLIKEKKNLSGKEIRFLRHEMLMSQSTLSRLLEVSEGAINRWENEKSMINKPAELLIRMLYAEYIGENNNIRNSLKRIANIEDEMDQASYELTLKETKDGWEIAA
jgi:putative transcriptional regulator